MATVKNKNKTSGSSSARKGPFLDLTLDRVFKYFFSSYPLVCAQFLQVFVPALQGADVKLKDITESVSSTETHKDKNSILDLLVELITQGRLRKVNIELQCLRQAHYIVRQLTPPFHGGRKHLLGLRASARYAFKLFVSGLGVGMNYKDLVPTYSVSVLAYDFWPDEDEFYHPFDLRNPKNPKMVLSRYIEFVVIELRKVERKYKGRLIAEFIDNIDIKELWAYCIIRSGNLSVEELALIERRRPEMSDFADALRKISREDEALRIAEAEEQFRRDSEDRLLYATETGMKQGIEKGLEQGLEQGIEQGIEQGMEKGMKKGRQEEKLDFVRRMLKAHIDREQIQEISGLSIDEIEQISKA